MKKSASIYSKTKNAVLTTLSGLALTVTVSNFGFVTTAQAQAQSQSQSEATAMYTQFLGEYEGTIARKKFKITVRELEEYSTKRSPFVVATADVNGDAIARVILGYDLSSQTFEGISSYYCNSPGCTVVDRLKLSIRYDERRGRPAMDIEVSGFRYASDGSNTPEETFDFTGSVGKSDSK